MFNFDFKKKSGNSFYIMFCVEKSFLKIELKFRIIYFLRQGNICIATNCFPDCDVINF